MFRFGIFVNSRLENLKAQISSFAGFFVSRGNVFDKAAPDIVFVFGGDGTLLTAIKQAKEPKPMFMLINAGNLGFYGECHISELTKLEKDFSFDGLHRETHRFIRLRDGFGHEHLACNEFMIANSIHTLDFKVIINGGDFMDVRGSGICLASPFGSSGYNHSLGGALIIGDSGMAMSLMAPIRNRLYHPLVSSLVLTDGDTVRIRLADDTAFETAGDMKIISGIEGREFEISRSDRSFTLAHLKPLDSYQRIRKAFLD